MILSSAPNCMTLLAPVCSSWTVVSRGTTWRNVINCMGLPGVQGVADGNYMLSRTLGFMEQHQCMLACVRYLENQPLHGTLSEVHPPFVAGIGLPEYVVDGTTQGV